MGLSRTVSEIIIHKYKHEHEKEYSLHVVGAVGPLTMSRTASSFIFFYSILRWSVAVSTMRRQSSRIAAFLQADARRMFCWPRSASTARSQVWLGLPNGRFQPGGSPRITAATARWWSSCGELRAICPKSRKRLSVTRWERGRHLVVTLTSTFVTWRVYGILRILRSAHVSNASMREHWSFVVDHVSHPYNKTGTMYVW